MCTEAEPASDLAINQSRFCSTYTTARALPFVFPRELLATISLPVGSKAFYSTMNSEQWCIGKQ